MECRADVNVPIGEICKLEDEFKLEVLKLKEKLHPDMTMEMDEFYNKMVVKMRYAMYQIMFSFPKNPAVNYFVNEVVKKLMIYTNPEENPTNGLLGTRTDDNLDVGLANVEVKVEEVSQESPVLNSQVQTPSASTINGSQLQPSTSAQQNDEAIIIPVINELPQLVGPVLEQNTNNRPLVIDPPVHISKKDMWKKLPLEPATCLVKDCGTKFDYRGFRQDHIDKDHQNTELACPLCPEHYTTYITLERHYQKKHALKIFQCTFANCAFTSKTKRQVTKHFEECHMVSAIVNNLEDKYTNQDSDDGDDDLSKDEVNSEENTNVRPINQGSTATVPSPVASGSDDSNELPVQQPSTSSEPKTTKRTCAQTRGNEECNQVYEDGLAQSSASVKKAKLDSTHSNITRRVDQSRHRCIIEKCALSFDNLYDLEKHTKLVHSHFNQLAISNVENVLTTVQNTNVGKRRTVSYQSSTEPSTSIHQVPLGTRLESRHIITDHEECIDLCDQGQSSSLVKKPKLNATRSDHAQVTEPKTKCNPTQEGPQLLNTDDMAIYLGLECFQLNCKRVFDTKEKLTDHMWKRHRIRAFPCPVKYCGKSFDDMDTLNDHCKNNHKNTTKWGCAKCSGHYYSQLNLFKHHFSHHTFKYKCTFAKCTFKCNHVAATCFHYAQKHMISCGQYDCANKAYKVHCYGYSNGLKHHHYK